MSDAYTQEPDELAVLRAMTPAQKLAVAHGLRETAWALTTAGVRWRHPELSSQAVEEQVREIFLRAASR